MRKGEGDGPLVILLNKHVLLDKHPSTIPTQACISELSVILVVQHLCMVHLLVYLLKVNSAIMSWACRYRRILTLNWQYHRLSKLQYNAGNKTTFIFADQRGPGDDL